MLCFMIFSQLSFHVKQIRRRNLCLLIIFGAFVIDFSQTLDFLSCADLYFLAQSPYMGRTDLYLLVQSPYMGRKDPIFPEKV